MLLEKTRDLRLPKQPEPWVVFSTLGKSGVPDPGTRFRVIATYESVGDEGYKRRLHLEKLESSPDGSSRWEPIDPQDLESAVGHILQDLLDERLTVPPAALSQRRKEREG